MRTVDEHVTTVRELLPTPHTEWLVLSLDALQATPDRFVNRTLAEDVFSPLDLPGFDNSQMDGYAVHTDSFAAGSADFAVTTPLAAGQSATDHHNAEASGRVATPIMTGAPLPRGTNAVVPIENTVGAGFAEHTSVGLVTFARTPAPGDFVRVQGSDVRAGDLLLAAGTRLGAPQLGLLASAGVSSIPVRSKLRVLVVSTGRELAAPGSTLGPAQIHDANGVTLTSALTTSGCLVTTLQHRDDDPASFSRSLLTAASHADLVVTTGGVSAGAYEVVREALTPLGVSFDGVAMQPGGPQGWGYVPLDHERRVPIVCFPGNPVSTLVSFEMFLRTPLREAAGSSPAARPSLTLPLVEAAQSIPHKHQVRRARITEANEVELVGGAGSHLLASYALSTALVHFPLGVGSVAAGTPVEVWRIDD